MLKVIMILLHNELFAVFNDVAASLAARSDISSSVRAITNMGVRKMINRNSLRI